MKAFFIGLIVAGCISFGVDAQPIQLKVMSINMKESGQLVNYDITPFCDFIRAEDPDFVALQEIQFKTTIISGRDMVTEMAAELGMFPLFGRAYTYRGGSTGVALLSKYPFFNARTIILDVSGDASGQKFVRSCSFVDVQLPDNGIVRLGATHLDHSTDEVRIKMIAKINGAVLKDELPTLMIGDFNAFPDGETIHYMKTKWDDIGDGTGNTFPYGDPTSRIDYVFGYPANGWQATSFRIVNSGISFSDHCPLIVALEY